MNLPDLFQLNLHPTPKSTQKGDSSLFFKNLNAPKLKFLDDLDPQVLTSLNPMPCLEQLSLYGFRITDDASAKAAVSTLIGSVEHWSRLKSWGFSLPSATASAFYEHLILLLTPLSKDAIWAGFREKMPLPGLRALKFGGTPPLSAVVNGFDLSSFVGARKAVCLGRSSGDVMAIANGLLETLDAATSKGGGSFRLLSVLP